MKTNRNENAGDVEILLASDSVLAVNPRMTFRWSTRSVDSDNKTRPADGAATDESIGLPSLKPEERTLLALADGRRSLESLAKLAGMTTPVAVRHLRALCDRGILVTTPRADGKEQEGASKWSTGDLLAPTALTQSLLAGPADPGGAPQEGGEVELAPAPAAGSSSAPASGPTTPTASPEPDRAKEKEREKKAPSGPNVTLFWIPATSGSGPTAVETKPEAAAAPQEVPRPRRNSPEPTVVVIGADNAAPASPSTVIVGGSGPASQPNVQVQPEALVPPTADEAAPTSMDTPAPSVAIPFRVGGYEVAMRIAQGAMGSIYVCRRASSAGFQRLFTMKVIRQYSTQREVAARSFQREAELGAVLNHPNVQAVVDVGDYEGQPFLIFDYLEGTSLLDLLGDDRRPSPAVVVTVILDVLRGLQHVHDVADDEGNPRGLVHGDVSPHNILISVDGVARLTDFGSARASRGEGADKDNVAAGKPAYMAPEQLRGEPVDARTDLFSVGAVMWTALTGQRLFAADSYQETVMRVMRRKIPPPSEFGVPAALDAVVLRALSRSPEGRYASADEMARDLSAVAMAEHLIAPERDVGQWVRREYGEALADRKRKIQDAFGTPRQRADVATSQPKRQHRPTPKTATGLERLPAKTVLLEAGEIQAALGEARSAAHRAHVRQSASRGQWAVVITSAVIAAFALTAAIIYLVSSLNTPPRKLPAAEATTGQVTAPANVPTDSQKLR